MFNAAELRSQTAKSLQQLAKSEELTGYSQLSKDELVELLGKHFQARRRREARAAQREALASRPSTSTKSDAGEAVGSAKKATNGSAVASSGSGKDHVTAPKAARSSRPATTSAGGKVSRESSVSTPAEKSGGKTGEPQTGSAPKAKRAAGSSKPRADASDEAMTAPASHEASGEGETPIRRYHLEQSHQKDITSPPRAVPSTPGLPPQAPVPITEDRITLLVRGPYWLQAEWDITRTSVDRARAALAEQWHAAVPVLRLLEVESGSSSNERVLRDIPIHGGVQNWFIDVNNPPAAFRVVVGYRGPGGKFHAITRSNRVQTPAPGGKGSGEADWADIAEDADRIFALSTDSETGTSGGMREIFEKRLRRSLAGSIAERITVPGSEDDLSGIDLPLVVDAALVVFGRTQSDARVTISGDPVRIHPDGSFTVKLAMPDRRQVIPVVASTPDGSEQRTVVLAVERNTKIMERRHREELD